MQCGPFRGLTDLRESVKCKCTPRCKFYDLCKQELHLPKDWQSKFWFDRESTEQEQIDGIYHEIIVETDEGIKTLRRTWDKITWQEKRKRELNGSASWTDATNSFQLLSGYGIVNASAVEQWEKETKREDV